MSRWLLAVGPAMVLASCALAFAQDGATPIPSPDSVVPGGDYVLALGPFGALVWGAYLVGKGVRVTVQVELSETDRALLRHLAEGGLS